MRGFDLRVAFALEKIRATIFDDDTEVQIILADVAHYGSLCHDEDMPIMFQDEPLLRSAWERGQKEGYLWEEIQHCNGCNNADGNPCHTHS